MAGVVRGVQSKACAGIAMNELAPVGLLAAWCLMLANGCLERRTEAAADVNEARCATCHGDPLRAGDFLQRAAPPRDSSGASGPEYPGVGAHAIHVYAAKTHGAVACTECHVVPEYSSSPGHADSALPAEVVLQARLGGGGGAPTYDAAARTCTNGWCHGQRSDAVWTEVRTSEGACGSCHGLPPRAPHPQSTRCDVCHGSVIDADRHFSNPTLHVDGTVQVESGACDRCHGSAGESAPPQDTLGNESSRAIGVGAHRAHLAGGAYSRPMACSECHAVPASADDVDHIEGLPARVELTGVGMSGQRAPSWNRATASCSSTWCHGPSPSQQNLSPRWTSPQRSDCGSCHGAPPPAPHPQLERCSQCHASVVAGDDRTIIARALHVDGVVDVTFDGDCTACHGDITPAPPKDLAGNRATTFAGVGAHQAHSNAGPRARAVSCSECHAVPRGAFDVGHLDSAGPAEVEFTGVANAFGGTPLYANGTCNGTSCHGGKFPGTHRSGGANVSPRWTSVDGTQASCGTCHGLPPPAPHPYQNDCSSCHRNIASDNVSFTLPELHVDGIVTFTVP